MTVVEFEEWVLWWRIDDDLTEHKTFIEWYKLPRELREEILGIS